MTAIKVCDQVPFSNEVSGQGNVYDNIHINDSSNIHLGSDIQYCGHLKIQQYVNGLPEELATKPEVGQGLAKAGLLAATSMRDGGSAVPHFVTLLLPSDSKQSSRWLWISTSVVMVLIAIMITVTVIILARNEIEQIVLSTDIPIHGPSTSEDIYNPFPTPQSNVTLSAKLRIIERREWLGQPVHHEVKNSTVQYILVMETGGDTCNTEALCKGQLLSSQQYDMGVKNLDDIAPNFLLGGDGYAYEGRNWNTENQCSLNNTFDKNSICISFVGRFGTKSPSDKQLVAAKKLIDLAIYNKNLSGNYSVLAVRQISHDSENPGHKLFEKVKEWPNWKSNV